MECGKCLGCKNVNYPVWDITYRKEACIREPLLKPVAWIAREWFEKEVAKIWETLTLNNGEG